MLRLICSLLILSFSLSGEAKDCVFKIKKDSIKVEWTGYKFTEKSAVTGRFLDVTLLSSDQSEDIVSFVRGIKFKINALKFDAGNEARNMNLSNHFFKKFTDNAVITGEVKEMDSGMLTLMMLANGVRANIPMKYQVSGNKFKATGSIEVSDFALENALASISKACFELHKGKDGKSKTWPTVDLMASAEFKKVCK